MHSYTPVLNCCFVILFIFCTTFCDAASLSLTAILEDSEITRSKRSTCAENAVTLPNELIDLGKDGRTVCPFHAKPKSLTLDHPAGNVNVQFNQIICSGACANNCGAGRSCKQLKTRLEIKINNAETGLPDRVYSVDANIGCSCTPDDDGSPGEVVIP